jgi:multiple sugar transport system substrate-binding protein
MANHAQLSRRFVLKRIGAASVTAVGLGLLAACGQQAAATPTAAPAGATPAPAAKPTTAPAVAPTTAGAAAATPAPAAAKGGPKISIWIDTDYLPATTDNMQKIFQEYGTAKNVTIDFNAKSNMGDQLNAAVQAGTPPDIWRSFDYSCQYWHAQDQAYDVTNIVNQHKGEAGGLWEYVLDTVTSKGKMYASPYAVNAWPLHTRQDVLDKENGGKWPDTWDDFRILGKKVTKAPDFYGFGWTLGKIDDANNHFIAALWTYGGKLQNDDGSFALKANDPAAIAVLQLAKDMYEVDKIIPPASVQWDNGGNNTAYQDGTVLCTSNPTSIYGWLVKNKPDLAKVTTFQPFPKGPTGSFGQVDVWGLTTYKNTKFPDQAQGALDYFLTPDNHKKYIEQMEGRFLPVFKSFVDLPMWQTPVYKSYTEIAKTGRIMAYSAPPAKGYSDFTTRYLIGSMMQDLIVRKQTPQAAYNTFYEAAKAVYANYA